MDPQVVQATNHEVGREVTQYRVVTGAVELNLFLREGWKYVELISSVMHHDKHPTDPQGWYYVDRFLISKAEVI